MIYMATVDLVLKLEVSDEVLAKLAEALGVAKPKLEVPPSLTIEFSDFGGKVVLRKGE